MLGVAALLALSNGLLETVNSIPSRDLAALAASVARSGAGAFCGIAPGLALLLLLERGLLAPRGRRWAALAAGVVLLTALATVLHHGAAVALDDIAPGEDAAWEWAGIASIQLVWIALVTTWREATAQRRSAIAALHASELRSIDAQARLAEADLRMLQAQIEPHFLFNSLANVRLLFQRDGDGRQGDAGRPVAATCDGALPRLRETASTLAREAEVARGLPRGAQDPDGRAAAGRVRDPADLGRLRFRR